MSSRKRLVFGVVSVAAALAPFLLPAPADAIPAFARQHKTECSTCHTIYPELNEFGEAFLRNSYVYPKGGAEAPAAEAKEGAGRTEGLWLSAIPEQIPISLTATLDVLYDREAVDEIDLSSRSLRLEVGTTFREAAALYATYNAYAQGVQRGAQNNASNSSPNINELFGIWRHALGTPVNVRIGRMEPKLSLWKKSNRVISLPSFAPTTYAVGASQFSLDAPQDALELSALLGGRVLVAGGVVDRNGQDSKEGFGHLSVKFGGTDFKGEEPEVDLEEESVWDYLAITLGAFGYSGKNGVIDATGVARNQNSFYRAGAEFDLIYKRLRLKGSGAFGRDDNPDFSAVPVSFESHAYAFEGEYLLGSPVDLMAILRYEYQENLDGGTRRVIPALAYAPLQNTRLSLQFNYEDTPARINRLTLGSVSFSF